MIIPRCAVLCRQSLATTHQAAAQQLACDLQRGLRKLAYLSAPSRSDRGHSQKFGGVRLIPGSKDNPHPDTFPSNLAAHGEARHCAPPGYQRNSCRLRTALLRERPMKSNTLSKTSLLGLYAVQLPTREIYIQIGIQIQARHFFIDGARAVGQYAQRIAARLQSP